MVRYLADQTSGAAMAGQIVGAIILPALGLVLLIVGLRSRSAARRRSPFGYYPGYPPVYPPPFPQPPGYPPAVPGYPGAAYPPLPPARKAGTGLIVTGIVLLSLGAVGIVGTVALAASKYSRAAIGDCFTNEILDKSRWKSTSCQNPQAVLEFAATTDANGNCPDGKLIHSGYLSLERDGTRRCFIPNLLEGHCYAPERNDETVRTVSCGTAGKVIRVVKRLDGTIDISDCPAGSHGVTFPQPKRTYCTERVQGAI